MTGRELLVAASRCEGIALQFLHECVIGARRIKAKRGVPQHTRIEFGTQRMTPDDLLYLSGELGQPASRKPEYVGVIVWIPSAAYDEFTRVETAEKP